MQTYAFHELDSATQARTFLRYVDEINAEIKPHHRDATVQEARAVLHAWRFTEHGERIA